MVEACSTQGEEERRGQEEVRERKGDSGRDVYLIMESARLDAGFIADWLASDLIRYRFLPSALHQLPSALDL